ncbi:MAG: cupin domain-containing protein [Acidobacteria bacterium]|nr:cupin domain-containing protein [Acidobacteriota bacterium]
MTAQQIIELLQLEPLPVEGGLFRQTYCSAERIRQAALPARYRGDKPFATAIYYLLTSDPDSFSALHRLPTDEVYHFYLGDPVEMLLLFPQGGGRRVVLGQNILHGQQVQFVAPSGVWQGSRLIPGGRFALLGTTMAPGFDASDYQGGQRAELLARYPDQAELIRALTRS